jgi:hypothetical protein
LCPGEIKHELAVGMALGEGWRGGGQSRGVIYCDVSRIPTCAGTNTVRVLEGRQELVAQERVAISSQGIPLPRVEVFDAVMNARWGRCGQECFSISNPSR